MEQKRGTAKPSQSDRETRLKAALKANLGRRKAQARARSQRDDAEQGGDNDPGGQED